jgi:hypothetical protein
LEIQGEHETTCLSSMSVEDNQVFQVPRTDIWTFIY